MAFLSLSGENAMKIQLLEAAASGDLRLLKQLAEKLDKGDGIVETIKRIRTPKGRCALHRAAARGKTEICQYLIEELGFPVDYPSKKGETPLLYAANEGRFITASYLIEQGADPTTTDDEGSTPLFYAVDSGHAEVVKLLLSKGVHVDPQNSCGIPLHQAARNGDDVILKILLQHGADINNLVNGMLSPLLCSIMGGSFKCTKLLIEAQADLNLKWPLDVTIIKNKMEMMKCLLDAGADPNIPNEYGTLPVERAVMRDRKELVEILFPLTFPIPEVKCWSIDGLYVHVNSSAFLNKLKKMEQKRLVEYKMKGADAFKRKEFISAVYFYEAAIGIDPTDATIFANTSICWLKSGFREEALKNACMAQSLRPDWPKAYYRVGAALMLLKEYEKAYRAFSDGQKLNPLNEDIKKALQNALDCMKKSEQ